MGDLVGNPAEAPARHEFVTLAGQRYACIRDVDHLAPFLMSIVSDSDAWLFVGSNSPFTAGRVDPDGAMFPYQTVDKLLRHADGSGSAERLPRSPRRVGPLALGAMAFRFPCAPGHPQPLQARPGHDRALRGDQP